MKLYVFPPSPRAMKVIALAEHLQLEHEVRLVDLTKGDQMKPEFTALNPNQRMPVLEDDGFVLWESNAILLYLASKKPHCGLWPNSAKDQADVLRWLVWESAHFDAESCGMVGFEKISKAVLGLGAADPAFIARGETNFARFAAVLNESLRGRNWLTGGGLTIADFSIGAWVPAAERLQLPVGKFSEIARWYGGLASLPAWRASMVS
jgi:glutathione S-transferase